MKEVSEPERLFVLMGSNERAGRRGGRRLGSSKNCKTMGADGRDTLNDNGEWPLFVSANHGLALRDIFFSTAKIATSYIRSICEAKHVLTTSSRDSETKHSCGTLLCSPNHHSYPSRTTTSSQHIYLCKCFVCMYVWSELPTEYESTCHGCQSCSWSAEQENYFFPYPSTHLIIRSRETGSAVPSCVSPFVLHTQAESGAYSRESSRFPRRRTSQCCTAVALSL